MQFVDKCIIEFKAGDGGNGIVSWRKEAHYPEGGPWGGDGGNGGDIIIVGDHNQNSLFHLRYNKKISAQNGENGGSKLCHGANGENVYVKVPIGTVIKNEETGEVIVDILQEKQTFVICKGGKGGHGNAFFKSSYNKAPKLFENGDKGEYVKAKLELKYIADVGMVGFPNAGKSTFISKVSNAKPKVANYKFTTLTPVLGVVKREDNELVFADIPGIIEGASDGVGLGFEFLKHIERCHFLIHLISMDEIDNEDAFKSFEIINNELKKYKKELLNKRIYIVANKIDSENSKKNIELMKKKLGKKIYFISAIDNKGIDTVVDDIFKEYKKYQDLWKKQVQDEVDSYKLVKVVKEPNDAISISQIDDGIWNIESKRIQYWFDKIPQTTEDNLIRFNQKIKIDEIQKMLIEKGAKIGDTFIICGVEYVID